jgi:hypothetical protein
VKQERAKEIEISTEWIKQIDNKKRKTKCIFIVQISSLFWRGVGFLLVQCVLWAHPSDF